MKIYWTHTAIRQRNAIFEFWNKRNGTNKYSDKTKLKIKDRLSLLKRFPKLGKPSSFKDYRLIPMSHFSLYSRIKEEAIFITAFWDNRQDPTNLLEHIQKNYTCAR